MGRRIDLVVINKGFYFAKISLVMVIIFSKVMTQRSGRLPDKRRHHHSHTEKGQIANTIYYAKTRRLLLNLLLELVNLLGSVCKVVDHPNYYI